MINRTISSKFSLSPTDDSAIKRANKRENTRSKIALFFIIGYLGIIVLLILLTTFFRMKQEAGKDFLLAVGNPLGFIIGYYFKSHEKE